MFTFVYVHTESNFTGESAQYNGGLFYHETNLIIKKAYDLVKDENWEKEK